ncbi:MAG: GNAT family N-acetyltransferase [Candidatus Thiothrix singaporensis]|uniref:GNAT family N-acetyltransferase n=1 Tax=Candidatus Thiothrix singaporensis TaxID=2799669 RepID=A0A7L6AT77_9GAMM|nr:MAG: GNAT family N-acetyltransferase [Candidatus Thiothrix singaporensis]
MITMDFATQADIPALCGLLDLLFTQEAEFQPDRDAQQRGLAAIIGNPAVGHILVARQDHAVVGMANLLYTVSTALGGKVALLEDMVMAPQVRGQGMGQQLLGAAIRHAQEQGCLRITLLTDTGNHVAQAFYKSMGFAASGMLPMRLMLPE